MAACPKCGEDGVDADRCANCGVVIPLYLAYLDKLRARPGAPAPTAGLASTVVAGPPVATVAAPVVAQPGVSVAPTRTDPGAVRKLRFHGTGESLFGMWVVNVFLTLITLGICAAWARVRMRK